MSSLLNLNEITFGFDLSMTNHKLYSLTLLLQRASQNFWINESRFQILNSWIGHKVSLFYSLSDEILQHIFLWSYQNCVFLSFWFSLSSDPYPSNFFEKSLLRNGMSTFIWTFNTLQIQTNALSAAIILNKVFVYYPLENYVVMVLKRKLKIINYEKSA